MWKEVESTAIFGYIYDSDRQVLRLRYKPKGETYDYFDVPPEEVEKLRTAESIGNFVSTVLKPKYTRYEKVA